MMIPEDRTLTDNKSLHTKNLKALPPMQVSISGKTLNPAIWLRKCSFLYIPYLGTYSPNPANSILFIGTLPRKINLSNVLHQSFPVLIYQLSFWFIRDKIMNAPMWHKKSFQTHRSCWQTFSFSNFVQNYIQIRIKLLTQLREGVHPFFSR
jgi:hypothetical protein